MKLKLFAALLLAATAAACGSVVDPSQNVTENFSGTLTPASQGGGPFVFGFNVSNSGEYSIEVVSTTPATTSNIIGVGFGQMIQGNCSPVTLNGLATVGHTGSAGAIQQGSWCAIVYDPGVLTQSTAFTAWVKHP